MIPSRSRLLRHRNTPDRHAIFGRRGSRAITTPPAQIRQIWTPPITRSPSMAPIHIRQGGPIRADRASRRPRNAFWVKNSARAIP